jgi:hypothetical protein
MGRTGRNWSIGNGGHPGVGRGLVTALKFFVPALGVERQQHRHRAVGNAGKAHLRGGIESGKGFGRRKAGLSGQARRRSGPIDPRQSDVRRGEFLGKRRLGEDHHYADKQKAFQTIVPRSARS